MSEVDSAKVLKLCEASTGNGVPYHDMRRLANDLQWYAIQLADEVERQEKWIDDLQAGMYINCVYCGHRYGPDDEVPASMAEVLKEHVEQCPKHPMSVLKEENARLREALGFYADERNYIARRGGVITLISLIERDQGDNARAALSEDPSEVSDG